MAVATSERFEGLLQGCARALSGSAALALTFGVEERRFSPQSGRLTRRPPQMSPRQRSVLRGQADLAGLYRRLHDPAIHRLLVAANDATAAAILEEAEQARIALIGARRFVGVAANLAAMLDDRYVQAERIVAAEDTAERRGLALAALLLEAVGPALLARRYWLVETRRHHLLPSVQAHATALQAALGDQTAFGRMVLAIAATLPPLPPPGVVQPLSGAKRPHPKGEENAGGIEEEVRSTGEAAGLKVVTEEATGSEPLFGKAERTDVPNLETDAAPRTMREDDGTAQPVRRTTTDGEPPPDSYACSPGL